LEDDLAELDERIGTAVASGTLDLLSKVWTQFYTCGICRAAEVSRHRMSVKL